MKQLRKHIWIGNYITFQIDFKSYNIYRFISSLWSIKYTFLSSKHKRSFRIKRFRPLILIDFILPLHFGKKKVNFITHTHMTCVMLLR